MRETEVPSLVTLPTILGERHCPDQKGSVTNINQARRNNQANCFQYQDGWRHNFTIYQVHNRIQCLGIRNKTNTEYENIFILARKGGTVENNNNRDSVLQGNIGLGQVTRSVCRGVIENLAGMMGPEMLRLRGIQRIVGSGACLIRNAVIVVTQS